MNPVFRHSAHQRRGSLVMLASMVIIVVFAMVALSVDLGYICHADTELQRTADACALAAVRQLPNTANAAQAAQNVALANKGTVGPDLLDPSDIEFGKWDFDTATFTPNVPPYEAVRVTVQRNQSRGNPITLFFAGVIGRPDANVQASAVAVYDNNLCGPLVGIQWVEVTGTPFTDSYLSSQGSYGNLPPRDNGNICSDGPIHADGTSNVNGDANPGRGQLTTLEGGAIVTGNMSPRLRPLNLPAVDTTNIEFSNDNDFLPRIRQGKHWVDILDAQRNFVLDGGKSYTMPAGEYFFNDLILTGQSVLTVEPAVVIYVTGNLDTSGGDIINTSQKPNDLRIFQTGGYTRIAGDSDNYMVIYAPNSDAVITGSGNFHGAVVGKTLTMSGTGDVHYDEDLDLDDQLNMPKRVALVQ